MIRRWLCLLVLLSPLAHAATDPALEAGLVPRFGAAVPGDTRWRDQHNRPVTLGSLIHGHTTLLVLAYYHCPMLCPRVLQSLAVTLKGSGLEQRGLRVVAASIDPADSSTVAIAAEQTFLDIAQLPRETVHFLTGPAASSQALAKAAGIRYAYDPEHNEYAHPATYIILDREGRVARYLPAFDTTSRDLRLALADIDAGRRTTLWDQAMLLCYAYDPATGRYTFAITTALRIAAVATVLALLVLFWRLRRPGRR